MPEDSPEPAVMTGASGAAPAGSGSASRHVADVEGIAMSALLWEMSRPRGAGLFLMAHSMGCVLAIQMAGDEGGADLLGLEIADIGRHPHPRAAAVLGSRMLRGPRREGTGTAMRDMIWGPDHLYPADAASSAISSPSPGYEGDEVRRWPRDFPALAARVRIPVHYTLGDHEMVWRSGPSALADIAALFTASSRVVAEEQPGGGHNLSLGLSAVAYHLRVLSFAEECVLAHESTNVTSRNKEAGAAAVPIQLAGG